MNQKAIAEIQLPCSAHAMESAVRSFCETNVCWDCAKIRIIDGRLFIVAEPDSKETPAQ